MCVCARACVRTCAHVHRCVGGGGGWRDARRPLGSCRDTPCGMGFLGVEHQEHG